MLARLLPLLLSSFLPRADADIYFGKTEGAKKPAEVTAKTVFAEIPEYKRIQDKGLTKDDAEYWVLLRKANEKFNRAIRKVAEEAKFDVIAEKGTQKFDPTPPDITKRVIEALRK
jgi:hypothetical protein